MTWMWSLIVVAVLTAVGAYVCHLIDLDSRSIPMCEWEGCARPAERWFGGERYCLGHYDYLAYGLEEQL